MPSQTASRHEVSCCKHGGQLPSILLSGQQLDRGVFIPSASSPSLPLLLEQLGSLHRLETKFSGWPFPIPQCVQKGRLFQCSVEKRRDEDGMLQAPALSCW